MRVKLILFWFLKFAVGEKKTKSRLGTVANPGEFPFAVCVDGPDRCSGHSGTMNLEQQIVIMGVVDIRKKEDPFYQERKIKKYKLHENFSEKPDKSYYNDIAAGYVDKPFKMTKTIELVKIVSNDPEIFKSSWYDIVKKGEECLAMGWGNTYANPPNDTNYVKSNELKYIKVLPWTDEECSEETESGQIDMCGKGEVISEAVNPEDGLLSGDLGGPLMCGEYVYGIFKDTLHDEDSTNANYFILFYPYIKYFGIDMSTQITSNTYTIISLTILQYF